MILKKLVARDSAGNLVANALLRVYSVSVDESGVPTRGSLVTTLADENGAVVDQTNSEDDLLTGSNGQVSFMLPAGEYWVEVTFGSGTFVNKRYMVGTAQAADVGLGGSDLPTVASLLSALIGDAPTEDDDGRILTYVHPTGVTLLDAPEPPEPIDPAQPDLITKSANFTVALSDVGPIVVMDSGDYTVTLPQNSAADIPVGRILTVLCRGEVTFTPGSGATLNGGSASHICNRSHAVVTAFKIGADAWVIQGTEEV